MSTKVLAAGCTTSSNFMMVAPSLEMVVFPEKRLIDCRLFHVSSKMPQAFSLSIKLILQNLCLLECQCLTAPLCNQHLVPTDLLESHQPSSGQSESCQHNTYQEGPLKHLNTLFQFHNTNIQPIPAFKFYFVVLLSTQNRHQEHHN